MASARRPAYSSQMADILETVAKSLGVEINHIRVWMYTGQHAPRGLKNKFRKFSRIRWPVILPHKWVHGICASSRPVFEHMFNAKHGHYRAIWKQIVAQPWAHTHPAAMHPGHLDTMIGYRIHGFSQNNN